jgi:hypothetical protein
VGIIAAAAVTGGLAACGATGQSVRPAAARAPSAAAVQVRVQPDVTGWSGMVQRPDVIYVGMGGAPVARRLAWRHWGSRTAWASGKLDIYWPQPGPISGWHPAAYPVTVRLQDIQTHNGQPYYRKMAYIYVNRRGIAKSLQFRFSVQPGGSAPSWGPIRPGTAGGRSGPSMAAGPDAAMVAPDRVVMGDCAAERKDRLSDAASLISSHCSSSRPGRPGAYTE